MDSASFGALFDSFTHSVFRLETLQHYAVSAEDALMRSFRDGTPRPERSVRTDPWLRRIAVSTAEGKSWSRVHLIREPLSEYVRYELLAYIESQAVGEQISLVDLGAYPQYEHVGPDYWLFDAETDHAQAVLMHYDDDGRITEREHVTAGPIVEQALDYTLKLFEPIAVPLNTYLARAHVA